MRNIINCIVPFALFFSANSAIAETFPAKPVHLVVGYSAGGASDVVARLLAEEMSTVLKQPFIVENRPGAGGNIGAAYVAKSAPDGYTLFLGDTGTLILSKAIYKSLTYDPDKDFSPISAVADSGFFIVVHKDFPAKNINQLIGYARSQPGSLSYASPGNGSAHHVAMERFKSATDLDIEHVPYRGSNQATADLIAGHVPIMVLNPATTISNVRSNTIRALAALTPERFSELPDVPTTGELGIEGVESSNLWTLMAPAETPKDIIDILAKAVQKATDQPEFIDKLNAMGLRAASSSPEELAKLLEVENSTLRPYVLGMDLRLD